MSILCCFNLAVTGIGTIMFTKFLGKPAKHSKYDINRGFYVFGPFKTPLLINNLVKPRHNTPLHTG